MRFGLNTFLYYSPFRDESTELFATCKGWGFDTVEIALEGPGDIDPVGVRAASKKTGLAIGSLCACMGPGRDLRGTPAEQATAREYLSFLISQAALLGCPTVAGPLYSVVGRAGFHDEAERAVQFAMVVGHLRELGEMAQGRGVTLCVEPLNRFETDFLNTCAQAVELVDAVHLPAVKLHLDTFHMNIEEKDSAAAIRLAGPRLGHFHACGSDRGTPGADHTAWPAIVEALAEIGYTGDVVIESFTPDVKVIARAAAIWRRIEPTRDEIAVRGLKNLRELFGRPKP